MNPERFGAPAAALWAYWSRCRGRQLVPHRRDFDPMAIAPHLPLVSLIEREAPMVWRMRLVGTGIVNRSGELTGRNYVDLLLPAQRAALDRRLHALLQQPCGSFSLRYNHRGGVRYVVRVLALPLHAADGGLRQLITTNEQLPRPELAAAPGLDALEQTESEFLDIGAGLPDL